jgi:hypothetical protein
MGKEFQQDLGEVQLLVLYIYVDASPTSLLEHAFEKGPALIRSRTSGWSIAVEGAEDLLVPFENGGARTIIAAKILTGVGDEIDKIIAM